MDAVSTQAFLDELAEIYGLEKDAALFQNLARRAKLGKRILDRRLRKVDNVIRDASIKAYVSAPESLKKAYHQSESVMTSPDNVGTAAAGTVLNRLAGR